MASDDPRTATGPGRRTSPRQDLKAMCTEEEALLHSYGWVDPKAGTMPIPTGVAYIDLGILNPIVALTIAVCKASLVVLFFMHVWYRGRLAWVFLGAGVLWLAFLIAFTLSDVMTRGWIPVSPPWGARASSQGGPSP